LTRKGLATAGFQHNREVYNKLQLLIVEGLLPKGVVKEVGRFGKRPFVVKAQHDFFMP
jgi:hypothetical protein